MTRSSDWENPTLPAYNTTGSSPIPSSSRYLVIRSPGWICSVSTKLGIVRTLLRCDSRQLAADVGGEIVGQHRHRVGQPVADPLQPRRRGDDRRVGHRPGRHRGVGEHVLDVEHERAAMAPGDDPTGDSHRQRRRHGDDAVGAAEPPPGCDTGPEGEGREPDVPDRPASEVALVPGGQRVDPGDRSP